MDAQQSIGFIFCMWHLNDSLRNMFKQEYQRLFTEAKKVLHQNNILFG